MHILISLVILFIVFCVPEAALAQDKRTNLSVSPAIVEWIIAPGTTQKKTILVRNTSDKPMPVQAITQGLVLDQSIPSSKGDLFNAASWLHISEPEFILHPQQYRTVEVRVTVPQKAEPGGHYATLYFRQPAEVTATPQAHIIPRIGVVTMIVVEGNVTKQVKTKSLSASQQLDDLRVSAPVHNKGNVHAMISGTWVIKDWRGQEVGKQPVGNAIVLPYATRTFITNWKPPTPGLYSIELHLQHGASKLPVESVITWWLPWRQAAAVIIGALVLWLGVFKIRHRWARAWRNLVHT